MPERRIHMRENVLLEAVLSSSMLDQVSAKILNISIGGIYMEAHDTLIPEVGEDVNVTFMVDIDGENTHTFPSKLGRVDSCDQGCGIALILKNVDMRYLIFLERMMEEKVQRVNVA